MDIGNVSPANTAGVIVAGALERDGNVATYSNHGSCVTLFAPGSAVYAALPDGTFGYQSGTSEAAPLVSAILALRAATNPPTSQADARQALLNYATRDIIVGNLWNTDPNLVAFYLPPDAAC